MKARPLALLLAAALLPLVGCSSEATTSDTVNEFGDDAFAAARAGCRAGEAVPAGTRLKIATTVAPITSIVANVAGDLADITGIVPEGTNSHTYEPPPSVAATLAEADVVFVNGLVLEEPTKDLAEQNLRTGAAFCELGTAIAKERDAVLT